MRERALAKPVYTHMFMSPSLPPQSLPSDTHTHLRAGITKEDTKIRTTHRHQVQFNKLTQELNLRAGSTEEDTKIKTDTNSQKSVPKCIHHAQSLYIEDV
jgi:hypothetical protein